MESFSRCLNSYMMPGPNNILSGRRLTVLRTYTVVLLEPRLRGAMKASL